MNPDAQIYSTHNDLQKRDAKVFLQKFVSMENWNHRNNILMDIGCGSGDTTLKVLLPMFPDVESIIAIDVLPSMIKFAKIHNTHPKIKYDLADITDESTLQEWQGKITKIVSICCIHWVIDKRTAFKHIFNLLQEDGEAVIVFVLSSLIRDSYEDFIKLPKWLEYIKDVQPPYPVSNTIGYGTHYFREMLENIEFFILRCEEYERSYLYGNEAEARESIAAVSDYTAHIPEGLKEDFKDDFFQTYSKFAGRAPGGKIPLTYKSLALHLKKPHGDYVSGFP